MAPKSKTKTKSKSKTKTKTQENEKVPESDRKRCLRLVQQKGPYSPYFQHLYFYSEVSTESAAKLIQELRQAQTSTVVHGGQMVRSNPIMLHIHSGGGDVNACYSMVAAIESSTVPIIAFVEGIAASAATVIASACTACVVAPMSLFLIHQARTNIKDFEAKMDDIALINTDFEKTDRLMLRTYARRLGKTLAEMEPIRKKMLREQWMDAAETVRWGFADAVLQPANKAREEYLALHPEWDLQATAAHRKSTFTRMLWTSDNDDFCSELVQNIIAPCMFTPKPIVLEFVGHTSRKGFYYAFWVMNILLLSPVPIYGVAAARMLDMGVYMFLACHRHLVFPSSTMSVSNRRMEGFWLDGYAHMADNAKNHATISRRIRWFLNYKEVPRATQEVFLAPEETILSLDNPRGLPLIAAPSS